MSHRPAPEERYLLLISVGNALFGLNWQSEMARNLDVSVRTVQRWVAQKNTVPEGVVAEIATLLRTRMQELAMLAQRLE